MVKKFNEFIEEGFMSRMVDTVYNNEPKKENASIEDKILKSVIEWAKCNKVIINKKTENGDYVVTVRNGEQKDLIDRLRMINGLEMDIEKPTEIMNPIYSFRDPNDSYDPRYSYRTPQSILNPKRLVGMSFHRDSYYGVNIGFNKYLFKSLPKDITDKLSEGFMSRMVDTVYNDKPKKENDSIEKRISSILTDCLNKTSSTKVEYMETNGCTGVIHFIFRLTNEDICDMIKSMSEDSMISKNMKIREDVPHDYEVSYDGMHIMSVRKEESGYVPMVIIFGVSLWSIVYENIKDKISKRHD